MSAAVVNRNLRRWKLRIGERTHGDAHGLVVADLGVEHGGTAHGAEPEQELRALIADAEILGRFAGYFEWRREAGERREHTTGTSLAGEAMTHADAARLALYLNAQLAAGA